MRKNARMAILQVLVTGLSLLFLYRFLLNEIGIELLGVWSLVLATSSIVNVGNLGLSGSVVKFVAKYITRSELVIAAKVIETAAISLGGVFFILLGLAFPVISSILEVGIPIEYLDEALSLLPFSLISLWIVVVTGVFQSGLDGCQRVDYRSGIVITGSIINLVLAVVFVQLYGFIGLGYAQVLQVVFQLVASWIMLKRELISLPLIPYRWRQGLFREMLRYGINFQIGGIAIMLCEPATKWLLSYFGGLTVTGYYEMASRMVIQFRAIPIAANQVLVPVIAGIEETDIKNHAPMYTKALRLMLFVAIPYYAVIVVIVPLISRVWIGSYEENFVTFSMLLVIGAFLNTLISPAYFSYLGKGRLQWNMIGHVTIAVLNISLGAMLGALYGSIGVVVGSVFSVVVGSGVIIVAYHLEENISWYDLHVTENIMLMLASTMGVASGLLIYYYSLPNESLLQISVIMIIVFMLFVLPVLWIHPLLSVLLGKWINNKKEKLQ